MKFKKMLSVLLAAVMVFSLMCTPAFAASPNEVEKALDEGGFWVDLMDWEVKEDVPIKLRMIDWSDDATAAKETQTQDFTVWKLSYLPMDSTLTVGPNFELDYVYAYSDPDGDGIYEQRLERDTWHDDEDYDFEIVPLSEPGPFVGAEDVVYSNCFTWGYGNDWLELGADCAGYRSLSSNYLVELFGADTILEFSNGEGSYFWYLTGEKRGEPVGSDKIENYNVTVSGSGYLVSTWARDYVDPAWLLGLIPPTIEESHNYNMRGEITRGEFAAVAMCLYMDMMDADTVTIKYPAVSPFADVDEDNPNYKYIAGAYNLGIVNGTSAVNKTFSPDALVSRQDAAVMLARVYEKVGGKIPAAASTSFADNNQIGSYAKSAVSFMSSKGIINGVGGNRFNPKGNASVEQALKIALEMLDNLG